MILSFLVVMGSSGVGCAFQHKVVQGVGLLRNPDESEVQFAVCKKEYEKKCKEGSGSVQLCAEIFKEKGYQAVTAVMTAFNSMLDRRTPVLDRFNQSNATARKNIFDEHFNKYWGKADQQLECLDDQELECWEKAGELKDIVDRLYHVLHEMTGPSSKTYQQLFGEAQDAAHSYQEWKKNAQDCFRSSLAVREHDQVERDEVLDAFIDVIFKRVTAQGYDITSQSGICIPDMVGTPDRSLVPG